MNASIGAVNGLSRTALKLTLPGVPDIYQGTEFWDLSLVDPDNRRPVDYEARARALDAEGSLPELLTDWRDGRVKQRLSALVLADRAASPALYADGDYRPLATRGTHGRRLVAYLREHGGERLAVVAPRLVTALMQGERMPLGTPIWGDTSVALPAGRWRNLLTGETAENGAVGELFRALPIAVLRASP